MHDRNATREEGERGEPGPAPAEAGSWTVREYGEEDGPRLVALFSAMFGRPYTLADWRWKYLASPSMPCLIGVMALSGEQAIGHWGGFQVRLKLGKRVVIAGSLADVGVHPQWRRQGIGILRAMTAELGPIYERRMELGQHPGAYIQHGMPLDRMARLAAAFLGSQPWIPLVRMRRRLNVAHALRRRGLPKGPAGWVRRVASWAFGLRTWLRPRGGPRHLRVRRAREFDEAFDGLWERASQRLPACVVRDRAHLAWRYARPGVEYVTYRADRQGTLAGYLVGRVVESADGERVGHVMDLLTESDTAIARRLLHQALLYFAAAGVDHAECILPKRCAELSALRELGFKVCSDDIAVYALPVEEHQDPDDLRDLEDWYFTVADSDHL